MPTGYDLLEHSHEFRMHMLKRVAAALIDVVIIYLPLIIFIYLLNFEPVVLFAGMLSGLCWFIYSVVCEMLSSSTIGKKAMGLIVISLNGPMRVWKSAVRNIPKLFWYFFLPLDIFIGLAINPDPRQRWVDGLSQTSVIRKIEKK